MTEDDRERGFRAWGRRGPRGTPGSVWCLLWDALAPGAGAAAGVSGPA